MNSEILYKNLMEALRQKAPQKSNLANDIMNMLLIEKEAAYRRLRGEVPFSFSEIATISKKMGISIDNIIGSDSPKSRPFHLQTAEYINPTEADYAILEEYVNILRELKETPNTEGGEATNILPQPLYLTHENISKFYLFKWKFLYNNSSKSTPYNNIVIPDRLRKIQLENVEVAKYISNTYYILDNLIFTYLINDIKYFRMTTLITDEDAQLIKQDIIKILDELEVLSTKGYFPETGNKIFIYISNINFSASYCYIEAQNHHITLLKSFILNGISSIDNKVFQDLKAWIRSLKRQSTLITQSGERQRINFFKSQREIINSL